MPLKIHSPSSHPTALLNIKPLILATITVAIAAIASCGGKTATPAEEEHHLPDTLRVGTLYSPTSYFLYKGEEMGYEYELISNLAKDKGMKLDIKVAHTMNAMLEMLDSGLIDVIAYEIPITAEYRNRVIHCGKRNITHQVLVQHVGKKDTILTDVTQLPGKEVWVIKDSKYDARLRNLDNELGGGIGIRTIDKDTLIAEDLIEMVANRSIPLTIVDSDIARLNKTYYTNIDISLQVSLDQKSSWAVAKDHQWLADSINAWTSQAGAEATSKRLLKRYFEMSKRTLGIDYHLTLKHGKISPYDNFFKHYSQSIGWDWRLLAAQAYTESHFDNNVVSWAGARGLMQIMPKTAEAYGLSPENVTNPQLNIEAAAKIIKDLDKSLKSKVPDETERINFIIAAYNSGIGHVYDAIEIAKITGRNPQIWDGNVAEAILLKAHPEYYNNEVCRFGYFKGKQTIEYVAQVKKIYQLYKAKIKY